MPQLVRREGWLKDSDTFLVGNEVEVVPLGTGCLEDPSAKGTACYQ